MTIQNAHILKWYRWQIWCAEMACRPLRQTFLIQWHNEEYEKSSGL